MAQATFLTLTLATMSENKSLTKIERDYILEFVEIFGLCHIHTLPELRKACEIYVLAIEHTMHKGA